MTAPVPLVRTYTVGLVVPRCGINAAQVAEITARLRFAAGAVHADGIVRVVVPGFADGAGAVQPEVLNLARLSKVVVLCFQPAAHGVAHDIRFRLDNEYQCDEVWCCPEITQGGRSVARVNAVYQQGQQRSARPARYKRIPPWVEQPLPDVRKPKQQAPVKEKRRW